MHADGSGRGRPLGHIGKFNLGAGIQGGTAGAQAGSAAGPYGTAAGAVGGFFAGALGNDAPAYTEAQYEQMRTQCRSSAPGCYPTPGVPPDQPGGCTCPEPPPPPFDPSQFADQLSGTAPPPPPPPPRPPVKFAGTFRVPTGSLSGAIMRAQASQAKGKASPPPLNLSLLKSPLSPRAPVSSTEERAFSPTAPSSGKTVAIVAGGLGLVGAGFLAWKLSSK